MTLTTAPIENYPPEYWVNRIITKYLVTRYISSGSFGHVYEAIHRKTGARVALKVPIVVDAFGNPKNGQGMLLEEAKIYRKLRNLEKGIATVNVTHYRGVLPWEPEGTGARTVGTGGRRRGRTLQSGRSELGGSETGDTRVLSRSSSRAPQPPGIKIIVMDLLGDSLEVILKRQPNKRFSIETVTKLAVIFLDTLNYIHSKGYIHRDLKPSNFVVGYKDPEKVFCIDLGLAKKYIYRGKHIPFARKKGFCGTSKYASVSAHKRKELSTRDDLESLVYILVYLFNGKLPWDTINVKDKKERQTLIQKQKMAITPEKLCEGMPRDYRIFMTYVQSLEFDEPFPYSNFKKFFEKLLDTWGARDTPLFG